MSACGEDSKPGQDTTSESDASPQSSSTRGGFPPEPACREPATATPPQTEGPYYKPGAPRRRSLLEHGLEGQRLVIRGRVLTRACRPVARTRVDFWQADARGAYDDDGYRLRGYLLTDGRGAYRLETIVPGLYEGRTRHIHVKVGEPGGGTLTTQLYFPSESANQSDGIFDPKTVIALRSDSHAWRATFDFVVGSG